MLAGAGFRAAGAGLGILALSLTDLDEKAGLSNTAMGALLGTMVAPGLGTAIGAAAGFTRDLATANNDLETALNRANDAAQGSSLNAALEARAALIERFAHVTNDGGFEGNLTRISAFLSGDHDEFADSIRDLDDQIALLEGRGVRD